MDHQAASGVAPHAWRSEVSGPVAVSSTPSFQTPGSSNIHPRGRLAMAASFAATVLSLLARWYDARSRMGGSVAGRA